MSIVNLICLKPVSRTLYEKAKINININYYYYTTPRIPSEYISLYQDTPLTNC